MSKINAKDVDFSNSRLSELLWPSKWRPSREKVSYKYLCDTLGVIIDRHTLERLGCAGMQKFECNQDDLIALSKSFAELQKRVESLIIKK